MPEVSPFGLAYACGNRKLHGSLRDRDERRNHGVRGDHETPALQRLVVNVRQNDDDCGHAAYAENSTANLPEPPAPECFIETTFPVSLLFAALM